MRSDITEELKSVTAAGNIKTFEDMDKHTTFRAGGCADVFVTPQSITEAADIVRLLLAQNAEYTVIGNGSNLLVSDNGYRGCIVCMGNETGNINVRDNTITAGAGALLSRIANTAYEKGLAGLEFASGIPGTLGGAVVMNAGAYGKEMKDVIESVNLLDAKTGGTVIFSGEDMKFDYRTSVVKEHPYIVLEATLKLEEGNREDIKEQMDELAKRRKEKQPLEFPSAGSTFKRPEGYFAGKLIEDAGLKGCRIGGACGSEKHSGFVVNKGGATASDIIKLIKKIRMTVNEKFGVMLEPEVVILGEDIDK